MYHLITRVDEIEYTPPKQISGLVQILEIDIDIMGRSLFLNSAV